MTAEQLWWGFIFFLGDSQENFEQLRGPGRMPVEFDHGRQGIVVGAPFRITIEAKKD